MRPLSASREGRPLFQTSRHDGVELLRCRPLEEMGVPHGFTLRTMSFGEPANCEADREKLARALGLARVAAMRQVHGNDVRVLRSGELSESACDGLATGEPGVGVVVQSADCLPILFWGERKNVVAAVHAGWRGTLASVASRAVARLTSAFGASPEELHVALGPAIHACCFEVGDEVVTAFEERGRDVPRITRLGSRGRRHLDLVEDNRLQLREAGVALERIHDSGRCTYCEVERFYSYRREGSGVGRLMGAIGVR